MKRKRAFTLVELIVVITILAILGTIAFISLQWYSADARNSTRISNINNIKTSLELFSLQTWKYPLPDNSVDVTYSWSIIVWKQWIVWDNVVRTLSKNLSEKLTDPLTNTEYIYSVLENRSEYELMSLYEWGLQANNFIINSTYASTNWTVRVDGTYNWLFVKTSWYIIPTPSIITSEQLPLSFDVTAIKSQVINWWTNIPNIWNSKVLQSTWALSFSDFKVYTWSITEYSLDSDKLAVFQVMYDTYSWSSLENKAVISDLLSKTTDQEKIALTEMVVLNIISSIASTTTNYICDDTSKPTDNWHILFTVGTPTSDNQAYVQDASNCWYSCTDWYTWTSCEIAPTLITSTDCTTAWWIWVDSATDVYIGTTQWSWFCISPRFWDWNTDSALWDGWISWNGWWNYAADYYNWWDASTIDDTWNLYPEYGQTKILDSKVSYDCRPLWTATSDYNTTDDIVWRMKWLTWSWNTYTEARSIDWITGLVPHTVWTYPHAIPVLYIADCIDWVKDMWTTMTYTDTWSVLSDITYTQHSTDELDTETALLTNTTYQNRQKYLTAWTQKSGSHLPSAFSYISSWYASAADSDWDFLVWADRWEYQVACEASLLTDSNDDTDLERIWLSAIGHTSGTSWGRSIRIIGSNGCGDQLDNITGNRYSSFAARFVVRP